MIPGHFEEIGCGVSRLGPAMSALRAACRPLLPNLSQFFAAHSDLNSSCHDMGEQAMENAVGYRAMGVKRLPIIDEIVVPRHLTDVHRAESRTGWQPSVGPGVRRVSKQSA